MTPIVLGGIIFSITVSVIELILYSRRLITRPDRRRLKRRLKDLPGQEREALLNSILREDTYSDVPFLNRILRSLPVMRELKKLKEQANAQYSIGFYLLFSLFLATLGCIFGTLYSPSLAFPILVAAAGACGPWGYLLIKKKKRMQRFRAQLPEAMDLIARSLKAGHAFTSGLKLAAEQMEDPIGVEFSATVHEINFGVSVSDALRHMAQRIDCPDLQIFVVAVILQRETGGNLAEIMESNAHIIRERFKFQSHVQTLAAEGKLSAIVLFVLPLLVFGAIQVLNPEYMATLYTKSLGQNLLWTAGGMMVVGMLVVRRMVEIDA